MHIHIEENCPFIRTETSYLRAGNIFIYARSYLCIENMLIFMHRKHAHIYASKTRSYIRIENTLIFTHRKHAHIYASKTRSYLCIENTLIFMHRKHAHIYASKTRSYLCIEKHAHIYALETRSYLDAVQCVRVKSCRCGRMTPVLIKSTERRLPFIRFNLLRYVSHNC